MTGSSFAEQLRTAKETNAFVETEAAPAADTETSQGSPKELAHAPANDLFNQVAKPDEPTPTPPVVAQEPTPNAPATKKIRIGTQEFDTAEDALAYAQELELSLMQSEAYKQGVESARAKEPVVPAKTIEDEIDQELFENPKQALLKYRKAITDEIKTEIKTEATREQNVRSTWNKFYTDNADLARSSDVVDMVLQKNWSELGHLPVDKAMAKLAEKSRALLSSYKENALPSKELPRSVVQATTASGTPAPAVAAKKENSALDFVTQINQNRKRGAVKSAAN